MIETTYSNTAFDSNNIQVQAHPIKKTLVEKLLSSGQTKLPRSMPKSLISTRTAAISPTEFKRMRNSDPKKSCFWNSEKLEGITENIWARIFLILAALGKGTIIFVTPFCILSLIIMCVFSSGSIDILPLFFIYIEYLLIPCSILWGIFYLYDTGYWTPKWLTKLIDARVVFELNRRTGMVTLYKSNGKVRYSHPFIEFDCVLATTPSQQGMMNYSLLLAHRYNGSMHGVPIGMLLTPHETVAEYHLYWNMIQCYMDVSQPLPDTLILEEAREQDPTTIIFDKKTGRNPRYWRDMSDEEYESTLDNIEKAQRNEPPLGAEIDIYDC